jgi:predicted membrane metal-binding protein
MFLNEIVVPGVNGSFTIMWLPIQRLNPMKPILPCIVTPLIAQIVVGLLAGVTDPGYPRRIR